MRLLYKLNVLLTKPRNLEAYKRTAKEKNAEVNVNVFLKDSLNYSFPGGPRWTNYYLILESDIGKLEVEKSKYPNFTDPYLNAIRKGEETYKLLKKGIRIAKNLESEGLEVRIKNESIIKLDKELSHAYRELVDKSKEYEVELLIKQ